MAEPQAQQTAKAGDHSTIVQAGDHVNIVIGGAQLQLRRPQRRPINRENEIEIFYPQNRTINLVGRDQEKGDLWDWINSDRRVSARAVIGSAGAGKTRLAIDTLDRVTRDLPDWRAGFLSRKALERFVGQYDAADLDWKEPGLIVVDYAGASVTELRGWLEELVDVAEREGPKLRLLLLERRIEGWYDSLTPSGYGQSAVEALLAEPMRLAALENVDRRKVLTSTFAACHKHLGAAETAVPREGDSPLFDARLADPTWSDPLFLMMAAVVSVVDQGPPLPQALALSRPRLAKRFAERERGRLERLAGGELDSSEHKAAKKLLIHLAAYATLCAGLTEAQARDAAKAEAEILQLTPPGGPGVLADTLRLAYEDDAGRIGAIGLDAIGEAFVLLTLRDLARDRAAAEAFVLRAAQTAPHAVPRTLIRAFQNFAIIPPLASESELTADEKERLDDQRLLLALWKSLIAKGISDDPTMLAAIQAELPEQTTLLRTERVEVLEALLGRVRVGGDDVKPLRARLLNNYSVFLIAVGDREGALKAIREAVALRRELTAEQPEAFRPNLATSLNNLANRLSEVGDREGALEAIREAVKLYRELTAAQPEAFRPNLATSLNNLSNLLSAVGDREGALGAIREAVGLYRELTAVQPEAFRPDLAMSLNNLSTELSAVGDREGALKAIREAVALRRELTAGQPEAFRPDLATSLGSMSQVLSQEDDFAGARDAVREGITLIMPMAMELPRAFQQLVMNLGRDS